MGDFRDADKVLRGEIEDVQVLIDRKEKEISAIHAEMDALKRKNEMFEIDIEELYSEKKKLGQALRRVENE